MIGKAYVSVTPYYDNQQQCMKFKKRPVLVIGQADKDDYVILPISKISHSENIDPYFDIPMEISDYPLMNLQYKSYIRTHKQTVVHKNSLVHMITDFSANYADTYIDAIAKIEEFQKDIVDKAI